MRTGAESKLQKQKIRLKTTLTRPEKLKNRKKDSLKYQDYSSKKQKKNV